jgi:uncharacterized membrane protein YidH (DUF202 family)
MSIQLLIFSLTLAAVAIALIKLGALSVWVTVLSLALQAALLALAAIGLFTLGQFAWKRWQPK